MNNTTLFRIVVGVVVTIGGTLGYLIAAGPSIVLGSIKDDYVAGAEASGIDMTECKARQKTIIDPSGGMAMCAQDVYRGIQKQIDQIDQYEPEEGSSSQEEPPADSSSE